MEELLELKQKLLLGDISGALAIVEELEEMSRDDKINNLSSYAIILLKHLIKQQAEKRSTKLGKVSICNSVCEIERRSKRRKVRGYYFTLDELYKVLDDAYNSAINSASLEVEEGRYEPEELEQLVNKTDVLDQAITLIKTEITNSDSLDRFKLIVEQQKVEHEERTRQHEEGMAQGKQRLRELRETQADTERIHHRLIEGEND